MHYREDIDREFAELGATHFLHSHYPNQTHWVTGAVRQGRVFSVHYFNRDGVEIGYWIPDLAEFSGAHILEMPREWPRMKLADNLRSLFSECHHQSFHDDCLSCDHLRGQFRHVSQ